MNVYDHALRKLFMEGGNAGIRAGVLLASGHMEMKLREKDTLGYPEWENGEVHIRERIAHLRGEVDELEDAVERYLASAGESCPAAEVIKEASDVAIEAMICMSYFDVEMGKLKRGRINGNGKK